jgi:hypothetical protein
MIVYDLVCAHQHRFEGWFGSADDFARQRDEELIRCPMCDDAAIERRPSANIQVGRAPELSAPAMTARRNDRPAAERNDPPAADRIANVAEHNDALPSGGHVEALKLLRRLVAETENVGRAFPEEARKIHYEEAPKRGIRGQASAEEANALREEGIDFMSLPPFLTRDLN